jgi:colanic acid/amylovoran biosynthesis glycosyltransferase
VFASRIAYLVSEYPAPSHIFIRREVAVLREKGFHIQTFSIRKPSINARLAEPDLNELGTTKFVLPVSAWRVLTSHLWAVAIRPSAYCRAFIWALRHSVPGAKSLAWSFLYFAEAIVLARMLKIGGVNHLHNHFANASATVGIVASRFLGIPWSVTLHGSADWVFPNGYLLPKKIKEASFVACVSHYTRAQAMWVTNMSQWEKMFVSRCGIDVDAIRNARNDCPLSDPFRIVTVGRLSPEKGQTGLIQAFSELLKRGHNAELCIVGGGPMDPLLASQIADLGIGDKCKLVGQKTETEVMNELSRSNLFVLTSFMEGLPVVLMESMAMRVPVIAPWIAGIPELVQHEKTGLLFPPGDWNGLVDQMQRAIDDPEFLKDISERGFQFVTKHFDIRSAANPLARHFAEATADSGIMPMISIGRSSAIPRGPQYRLAFLAPELVAVSATFVYEELHALERRGIPVLPLSVHLPAERAKGEEALSARCMTVYNQPKWQIALAGLTHSFFQPRFGKAFGWLLSDIKASGFSGEAWKLVFQFLAAVKVARLLRRAGVKHLHIHFAHVSTQIGMYAAAMASIPFSVTAHANDIFERGFLLRQKALRAKFFLTISKHNLDYLLSLGLPADKLALVRCSVSFQRPAVWPKHLIKPRYRIGTLGRLVEKKGIDVLLRSMVGLSNVQLSIAGDGPMRLSLSALAKELGIADSVEFVGSIPHSQVSTWMAGLDVFVLACKQDNNGDMDGIPVVLMEAMSQGIPVVSTRLSGIPELVVHESTGLLVAPGDSADLANQLTRLLASVDLRERLARQASHHVQDEFGQQMNVDRLMRRLELEPVRRVAMN